MSSRRGTLLTLLVAAVAGAGVLAALRHARETLDTLHHEKQSMTGEVEALKAEHSRLLNDRARHNAIEPRPSTPEAQVIPEMRAALARIIATRKSNPPPPSAWQPYPRSSKGDIFPELLADHEYLRHYMAYERGTLEQRYADFFASTSVPLHVVEKFRQALLQNSIADLEREELIAKHGVPQGETAELSHLLAQRFDTEARKILGETGYAEFQRHEHTITQRRVVAAFAERLSYTGQSLEPAQATALVTIMASATEPFGKRQIPARKFTEEVIAQAKSVLSSAQWEELPRFQQEQDAAQRK